MSERPPRRKRYAGDHPRRFEERYKELDPARWAGEAEKVRSRGGTPAGTHVPVLVEEVLAALDPKPGETYLDATLGWGGHVEAIAPRLGPGARIVGIDLDAQEAARTVQRLAAVGIEVRAHHTNFAGLIRVLASEGLATVDLVLADLGASSMQIDRPERGFSFKHDGPLDMRMDPSRGLTAAGLLERTSEDELAELLGDLGDEEDAPKVARAIRSAFDGPRPPRTTRELAQVVLAAKGIERFRASGPGDTHPAARVFQALRMAVNREPGNLEHFLRMLPDVLSPGGRAALIAFHSGEARRIRDALRAGLETGRYDEVDLRGVGPGAAEVRENPRSRSARLFRARRGR